MFLKLRFSVEMLTQALDAAAEADLVEADLGEDIFLGGVGGCLG